MTTSVFHTGYDIELNLSLQDLGHPDREGLWEEIYKPRPFPRGLLLCMGLDDEGVECPASMYVKIRDGKRIASHLDKGIKPHSAQGEGPRHRALKERIALSAQRSGFDTIVEDIAVDGTRRTDVLVKGQGGRMIGWEVQLAHVTAASVVKRSNRAQRDGIVPLWAVDDVKAPAINRAPWTRLDRVEDWRKIAGTAFNVRGGVRELRMERCDERRATPCPTVGRGRCGGWHACWDPARGVYLDDLVARTAAGEYAPLHLRPRSRRTGHYMWVSASDLETFRDAGGEPAEGGPAAFRDDEHDIAQIPQPLDPHCHYGGQSVARAARVPRDSGGRIDAGAWMTFPAQDGPGRIASAARYVVPPDLIDFRVAFLHAEADCQAISDAMPSGLAIARGAAEPSDDVLGRLQRARTARLEIVEAIHRHPWWSTVGNRFEAEQELRNAALEVMSPAP